VLTNPSNISGILTCNAGYGIDLTPGIEIEERIGICTVIIGILSAQGPDQLIERRGKPGFGTICINGSGRFIQTVAILLFVIPRKEGYRLLGVLKPDYPDLLFTKEDISTMCKREAYGGSRRSRDFPVFFGS